MSILSQCKCIFCLRSDRAFTKEAHIIPESGSNEKLIIPAGYECDECNEGFSVTEQHVLRTFPGQFFRVAFVDKTKRGKAPTSSIKGGKLRRVQSPERPTIQIKQYSQNPHSGKHSIEQGRSEITWEAQNLSGPKVSAFLAKISLEYFCLRKENVYTSEYENLRCCANSCGSSPFIPFFIGIHAESTQAVQLLSDNRKILEASKPVWIRFPGFSGIVPTSKILQTIELERLRSFIIEEMPGQFLFISDPNWEKPIKVNLTLIPSSKIAKEGHNKLWQEFKDEKT